MRGDKLNYEQMNGIINSVMVKNLLDHGEVRTVY